MAGKEKDEAEMRISGNKQVDSPIAQLVRALH